MIIHYKDLDRITQPATVLLDYSALDVWEYWFSRASDQGLVINTVDITGLLLHITQLEDSLLPGVEPDVLLHFVCTQHNSELAELLYHRGADGISWDFDCYTPQLQPIPDWAVSTPHLRGLVTVGSSIPQVYRGGLSVEHVIPTVEDPVAMSAALWDFAQTDLGTSIDQLCGTRRELFAAHWREVTHTLPSFENPVNLPHTQRFVAELRRRRRCLQHSIRAVVF